MRYASLCSGVGGLDLAMREIGGSRCVLYCEADPYRQAVLLARMRDGRLDSAPIWPDLRTLDGVAWSGVVDCVIAGFPCPPFSTAGRRLGGANPRNLWPDVRRVVSEVRPGLVFLENVHGLATLSRGEPSYAWNVLADLAALGYDTRWGIVSARDAGAPHLRERWFCMAYVDGWGSPQPESQHPPLERAKLGDGDGRGRVVGNPNEPRLEGWALPVWQSTNGWPAWPPGPTDSDAWSSVVAQWPELAPAIDGRLNPTFCEWLMGFPPAGWTDIPGATRRKRLEALGDAVVPAQAVLAWRLLMEG